jgi:Flp pilus assembly protein TadG
VIFSEKLGKRTRIVKGEAGATAVEFALILPVLILLTFGAIQFGIVYNRIQGLQAATREGARLASIGGTFDQVRDRVRDSQSLFTGTDVAVTTNPSVPLTSRPCSTAGVGNDVTVTANVAPSSTYALDIPLFGNFQINYNATGVFRCEHG